MMADEVIATETTNDAAGQNTGQPSIAVKVYAPFKVYFEGEARSVSAVNDAGPFDILPKHHKFLCMLVPSDLVIRPLNGNPVTIKIHRALMHVKAGSVVVFMDV